MSDDKLNILINNTLESINRFTKNIEDEIYTVSDQIYTTVKSKNGVTTAEYKGPDGSFKIVVDTNTPKVSVDSKFGVDVYDVVYDQNKCEVKGTKPIFHQYWSVFNDAFKNIHTTKKKSL